MLGSQGRARCAFLEWLLPWCPHVAGCRAGIAGMVVTVAEEAWSEWHVDGCIWSLGQREPWKWARESPGVLTDILEL